MKLGYAARSGCRETARRVEGQRKIEKPDGDAVQNGKLKFRPVIRVRSDKSEVWQSVTYGPDGATSPEKSFASPRGTVGNGCIALIAVRGGSHFISSDFESKNLKARAASSPIAVTSM